jgi:hypothetical protein
MQKTKGRVKQYKKYELADLLASNSVTENMTFG